MAAKNQFGALALSDWLIFAKREDSEKLESVLAALFDELRGPLFRYLIAMLGSAAEAEDAAQECFLRLFVELRNGKKVGNPKAWLFRVGHRLVLDRWRSAPGDQSLEASPADVADDRQLSSEENLIQQERLQLMRAAMNRLSTQQRLCLHLRTESFRYREIAEILGISESTVCENIRRGLTRLIKDCHEL